MSRTASRHDTHSALVAMPTTLDRLRRRLRLVRHSHSVPSIMLICRLMLRHLNKNCVMSMQQRRQQQRGSIIGSCLISGRDNCGATTVDRIGGSTAAWQLSTLSSSAASPTPLLRLRWLWARLICVNRVSYASTIMKTLLTCILVEMWDETSLCFALSLSLPRSLPLPCPRPLYFLPQLTGLLLTTFLLFLLSHTHTLAQREFLIEPERPRLLCPFFSCQLGLGWAWSGLHLEHRVRWTVSSFVGDLARHILFPNVDDEGGPSCNSQQQLQLCNCATATINVF